jgi:hypothetical protein
MATVERPISVAERRAWAVFSDAIDTASTDVGIPSGAAIVAADAPDLDTWKHRYESEGRTIVIVEADEGSGQSGGRAQRGLLIVLAAALFAAVLKGAAKVRIPA